MKPYWHVIPFVRIHFFFSIIIPDFIYMIHDKKKLLFHKTIRFTQKSSLSSWYRKKSSFVVHIHIHTHTHIRTDDNTCTPRILSQIKIENKDKQTYKCWTQMKMSSLCCLSWNCLLTVVKISITSKQFLVICLTISTKTRKLVVHSYTILFFSLLCYLLNALLFFFFVCFCVQYDFSCMTTQVFCKNTSANKKLWQFDNQLEHVSFCNTLLLDT